MLDKAKATLERLTLGEGCSAISKLIIRVDGIRPLLTHNPSSMSMSSGDPKKGSRIPEPTEEAEAGTYRLEDGTCAIKGEGFRAAMLGAASAWKAKNRATMKSHLSHIIVSEELVPLTYNNGTSIREYEIDARRAIVQRQGIIRHRPKFNEWTAEFTVEYDPKIVPNPKIIVEIANDAGKRMGVGDNRPQKNGNFGRFVVRDYALVD